MADQFLADGEQRANVDARVSVRIGKAVELDTYITTAGLLAVGVLVFGTLLGSAAIVLAAKRNGGRF